MVRARNDNNSYPDSIFVANGLSKKKIKINFRNQSLKFRKISFCLENSFRNSIKNNLRSLLFEDLTISKVSNNWNSLRAFIYRLLNIVNAIFIV